MEKKMFRLGLISFICLTQQISLAATAVELDNINPALLPKILNPAPRTLMGRENALLTLEPVKQTNDFNHTTHVRLKQFYAGYPVWGGEVIVHIPKDKNNKHSLVSATHSPNSTMNGMILQDLQKDLQGAPSFIFSRAHEEKAIEEAIKLYQTKKGSEGIIAKKNTQLMVYIDKEKAHWAFKIQLYIQNTNKLPEIPSYIIDAQNLNHVYMSWDDVRHYQDETVKVGGFGGNVKMGQLIYDGLKGNLAFFNVKRDSKEKVCFLQNANVLVSSFTQGIDKASSFPCVKKDSKHNNIYWDGARDQINGGYSPDHDAFYAGEVISKMYKTWYGISPLVDKNNKPMTLHMITHVPDLWYDKPYLENAAWDPESQKMFFGDGEVIFYPLTSLDVASHEISHGFTQQHSNLVYTPTQAGGMNEAFSDMAAKAVEYYAKGSNTWTMADDIIKISLIKALRYMDKPSKDCPELKAIDPKSECSIDSAKQFKQGLDMHYSSGVYNRAFYLLATTQGWNTRKAFDVMVKANAHYWTSHSTFSQGACGVIKAAKDYGYDVNAVRNAFKGVDVNVRRC